MINLFKLCRHVKKMEEALFECCVRGYHVYSEIWEAILGETLSCRRESTNVLDCSTVAVLKDYAFAKEAFHKVFSLFLRHRGSITC